MRHVSNIIGAAIRDEVFVAWDQVNAKASLRGTTSNLADDEALKLEQRLPMTRSIAPASKGADNVENIEQSQRNKVGGLHQSLNQGTSSFSGNTQEYTPEKRPSIGYRVETAIGEMYPLH